MCRAAHGLLFSNFHSEGCRPTAERPRSQVSPERLIAARIGERSKRLNWL
jgi:hypothetical protein